MRENGDVYDLDEEFVEIDGEVWRSLEELEHEEFI